MIFRIPCIKGNEIYYVQTYKFWAIFLLIMSNIKSLQGHTAKVLSPSGYKILYY